MVVCALGTIALGIVLVWALIRPGVIESVGTGGLAGVAGALLAPCLALAALRLDGRVARRDHLEIVIDEKLRTTEAVPVRDLGVERDLERETVLEQGAEIDHEDLVEEMSPVIARIFHEGEIRRLSHPRHSRQETRVTAG